MDSRSAKTLIFWFEHKSFDNLKKIALWATKQGYYFTLRQCQFVSEFDSIGNAIVNVEPNSIEIWKEVSDTSSQFYSNSIKQMGSKKRELGITHCGAISSGYE